MIIENSHKRETFQEKFGRIWKFMAAPFMLNEWKKHKPQAQLSFAQKLRNLSIKLALYYLFFSPLVAMPFYNTCIFHPFATGFYEFSDLLGVKKEDVFFKNSTGDQLHGWYFNNPQARKTVLLSHGNAGNISHRILLVGLLLQSGASVMIYDYAGYGLSKGSPSVDGCIRDAEAAMAYLLQEKKIPEKDIVLFGESLGTAITCQLAQKHPQISGIVLQSAFQSLPQIAAEKIFLFKVYPPNIFPTNQLDTLSYVQGKHPPILFIHGEIDNLIPPHNSQDLFKEAAGNNQLFIIPGAGHNDIVEKITKEAVAALKQKFS